MIMGYVHCYATEKGQLILFEQLYALKRSELWKEIDQLHVGIIECDDFLMWLPDDPKITVHTTGVNSYERHTLDILHRHSLSASFDMFYIHSKGASRPNLEEARAWRVEAQRTIIDNYKSCLESLACFDCVGPLGIYTTPFPFFAGNFWWATSSYVRTLCPPFEWGQWYTDRGSEERWAYETWITQDKPNFKFMTSGKHLI